MTRPARDPEGRGRAVAVYLTPTEERRLREAAASRGVSVSALVAVGSMNPTTTNRPLLERTTHP